MLTEEITRFITELSYEQLPAPVIDMGKKAVLDFLGVTIAGREETQAQIVEEYTRYSGAIYQVSPEQIAWLNGIRGHALDYDDYFIPEYSAPYHPTTAILPAVLAVGEKYHSSGKDVLLAYITGFEVESRIASLFSKEHYEIGWHITSTMGSVAAAAAVAKLLKLDEDKIRMALGISASLAGGLRKNFGTMTKSFHAGVAARNGVIAATLAEKGMTADRDILDSPLSFAEAFGSTTTNDITEKLGAEFTIVSPGIAFKPYPACAYTHWAIDATLYLRKEAGCSPDDINKIECRTSSGLPTVLIHSRPTTGLEGKFSMEFCIAASIIDGEATLRQFTDEKINSPDIKELIKKMKYVHPPEMGSGLLNLTGEIAIYAKDGGVYSRRVDIASGDPKNPLSWDDLSKKYLDCAGIYLDEEDAKKSLTQIKNLESVGDVAGLMDILTLGSKFH